MLSLNKEILHTATKPCHLLAGWSLRLLYVANQAYSVFLCEKQNKYMYLLGFKKANLETSATSSSTGGLICVPYWLLPADFSSSTLLVLGVTSSALACVSAGLISTSVPGFRSTCWKRGTFRLAAPHAWGAPKLGSCKAERNLQASPWHCDWHLANRGL